MLLVLHDADEDGNATGQRLVIYQYFYEGGRTKQAARNALPDDFETVKDMIEKACDVTGSRKRTTSCW